MNDDLYFEPIGPLATTARVERVLVAVGDHVVADQPAFEVVDGDERVTLPCPSRGRIAAVHVEVGREITVGDLLLTVTGVDKPLNSSMSLDGDGVMRGGCVLQVLAALMLIGLVGSFFVYGPSLSWLLLLTMVFGLYYLGVLGRFTARTLDAILLTQERSSDERPESEG